jgi:hypothetical protein
MEFSFVEISKLAKKEPVTAGNLLKDFAEEKFSLDIATVKINNSAVSLNSVNGFFTLKDNTELFFKFHAEEGEEETVSEYYRAGILENAGLPVISPVYESTKAGEQFLIYPKISDPTFFDVLEKMDMEFLETKKYNQEKKEKIVEAEKNLCKKSFAIAKKTLKKTTSQKVSEESIWQLFSKRLISENTQPRLSLFYEGKNIVLPNKEKISFDELAKYKWLINGVEYSQTLEEIIEASKEIVCPEWQTSWAVVTAHGDDHNGNKFFCGTSTGSSNELKFFDPAFAGENIPALLAFVKTTFHDVFAHPFYFYQPEKLKKFLDTSIEIKDQKIFINHNWDIKTISPLRKELLEIKFQYFWKPMIQELKQKNMLPENAKKFLKKSLFCCPFLCLNLINPEKFSPEYSLLALSKAVQMGTEGEGNLIDEMLSAVIPAEAGISLSSIEKK